MKIVLSGPKGVGKSTLGKKIASFLKLPFVDLDKKFGNNLHSLNELSKLDSIFIATGWSTPLQKDLRDFLQRNFFVVLLKAEPGMLRSRLGRKNFFDMDSHISFEDFSEMVHKVYESLEGISDLVYDIAPHRKSGTHREIGKLILKNYYEKND